MENQVVGSLIKNCSSLINIFQSKCQIHQFRETKKYVTPVFAALYRHSILCVYF